MALVVGFFLTSPPVPLSILERGNRGQGVKGVRHQEPTALVVGVPNCERYQIFETSFIIFCYTPQKTNRSPILFFSMENCTLLCIKIY